MDSSSAVLPVCAAVGAANVTVQPKALHPAALDLALRRILKNKS